MDPDQRVERLLCGAYDRWGFFGVLRSLVSTDFKDIRIGVMCTFIPRTATIQCIQCSFSGVISRSAALMLQQLLLLLLLLRHLMQYTRGLCGADNRKSSDDVGLEREKGCDNIFGV